jgi:endosialidase-like protein
MANTHGLPDTFHELQALSGDLLPAVVLSTTWPVVPASSLTLAPFPTAGYVRRGADLLYVTQPARAITLPSAAATYWLALAVDTFSAFGSYTRVPGSHYLYLAAASAPVVAGTLAFASVTVAGGVITAVTPVAAVSGNPPAWRGHLGLGSMAVQDATAVAVTGGQVVGLSALNVQGAVGINVAASGYALNVDGTAGGTRLIGPVGVGGAPDAAYVLRLYPGVTQIDGRLTLGTGSLFSTNNVQVLRYVKTTDDCLVIVPTGLDTGGGSAVLFRNVAGTIIGSISTTASATAFNTTSDRRLKVEIVALQEALAVITALRPVTFRWRADGAPGTGFVAEEVAQVVDGVTTGTPDAVDAAGEIVPMGIDMSKLLPWVVGALQALVTRVEALEARLA